MKKISLLIGLFLFFISSVLSISILQNVKYFNNSKYQLNIRFSKNIENINISTNKKKLNIIFDEKIFGSSNINFFLPINVNNEVLSINLNNDIHWYQIKKYQNILNISLFRIPKDNQKREKELSEKTEKNSAVKSENQRTSEQLKDKIIDKTDYDKTRKVEKKEKWVVYIDPGHGGKDPGAVGPNGTREKNIVLSVAKRIKKHLDKYSEIEACLTRSRDQYISLSKRAEIANKNNGDLFVSIHANAISGWKRRKKTKGVETYFLAEATSDRAREVAIKENEALKYEMDDYENMSYIEGILLDMADMQYKKESSQLAYSIQKNLINTTNSTDRGVQQALFYVLRFVSMPSVLIEIGFISHPREEQLLTNVTYQERIARNISNGILNYFKKRRNISGR